MSITLVVFREIEPDEGTTDEAPEKERCVLCGKELDMPKNLHIAFRECYVPGVGQFCRDCFKTVFFS